MTGSRSGRHAGRLRAHSDGEGASFVLRRRLRGGERVTVRTELPVRGTRNGDFTFRTARIPRRVTIQNLILENIPAKKTRLFRSRPDLAPPFVTVDTARPGVAPGHLFLSPKSKRDEKQAGPLIADSRGEPIWFQPLPGIQAATDFRAQTYQGKPVLTYWQGTSRQGIGVGQMVIRDQSYRVIRRIRTPNGFKPDLHEFVITPEGKAVIITYPVVRANLRAVKGKRRDLAVDSVIQEIDIATGLVTFEWHSIGNVPLTESFSAPRPGTPVRLRALQLGQPRHGRRLPDVRAATRGRSTRSTARRAASCGAWAASAARSGSPAPAQFAWQHDAHRRADGAITVFDNSAFPPVRKFSRALAIRLDEPAPHRLADLRDRASEAPAGGDAGQPPEPRQRQLPRRLGLAAHADRVRRRAATCCSTRSCRSATSPTAPTACRGSACRCTRPTVKAADEPGAGTDAYMSWNGATEVAEWELFAGSSASTLQSVGRAPRRGFETKMTDARRAALRAGPRARRRGPGPLHLRPHARHPPLSG